MTLEVEEKLSSNNFVLLTTTFASRSIWYLFYGHKASGAVTPCFDTAGRFSGHSFSLIEILTNSNKKGAETRAFSRYSLLGYMTETFICLQLLLHARRPLFLFIGLQ